VSEVENKISFFSIPIGRYIISLIFIVIGIINVLFLDSDHQAGVLIPLPYYVTTGIPPFLFGLAVLVHSIVSTNMVHIIHNETNIQISEKKIFTKTQSINNESINRIYLGNNETKYKFIVFGLWMSYIYFTFISGISQLDPIYGVVLIISSISIFIVNIIFLLCPRKKLVLENDEKRIWIKFNGDLRKIIRIIGIKKNESKKTESYNHKNYLSLIIGCIFIIIPIIMLIEPFGTYIGFFSFIFGIYLLISWLQRGYGNSQLNASSHFTELNQEFLTFKRFYYIKNHGQPKIMQGFKNYHPITLCFITYLGISTIIALINQIWIYQYFLSSPIYVSIIIILSIMLLYKYSIKIKINNLTLEIPLSKLDNKKTGFWKMIIQNNQESNFYFRLIIILIIIFLPIFIYSIYFPIMM